jgi:hypothetical protein
MVAPQYEALSEKYPDVLFLKVVEDANQDLIMSEGASASPFRCFPTALTWGHPRSAPGIRAFPTFRLYHNGQLLDEVQGARIEEVEAAILRHRGSIQPSFGGSGFSLGGGAAGMS